MKITAPEEYGLRLLLRVADAGDGHAHTIPELANAEGLTPAYVAKLMSQLRQAGLVESVRGRAGGYTLAMLPEEIKLGALLAVLGEPLFDEESYCQKHAGSETDGHCVHQGGCTVRALWQTLEIWMRRTLDQVTLADLLQTEVQVTELLRSRLAEVVLEPELNLIPLSTIKS